MRRRGNGEKWAKEGGEEGRSKRNGTEWGEEKGGERNVTRA